MKEGDFIWQTVGLLDIRHIQWNTTVDSSSSSGYSDEPFGEKRIQMIGIRRSVELAGLCR